MELLLKVGFFAFVLVGVLIVYSFVKFMKVRNVKINDFVENYEKSGALLDEENFRAEVSKKNTAELQSDYSHYMLEMEKFTYPDNQEYVMEMAQKANVIKELLTERNEIIPGNIN